MPLTGSLRAVMPDECALKSSGVKVEIILDCFSAGNAAEHMQAHARRERIGIAEVGPRGARRSGPSRSRARLKTAGPRLPHRFDQLPTQLDANGSTQHHQTVTVQSVRAVYRTEHKAGKLLADRRFAATLHLLAGRKRSPHEFGLCRAGVATGKT